MRFREENVALVGDIESMFHQVKVRPDKDSPRFLWWSGRINEASQEYAMTVHIYLEPQTHLDQYNSILLKTAGDNEGCFDPMTTHTLRHIFYVDYLLKSVPTPEEAIRLMQ